MKRRFVLAAKFFVSVAILTFLVNRVVGAEHAQELWTRLDRIAWPWLGVALLIQLAGIACSVTRWNLLLQGQGIHAPLRHLVGSFWIGRFFGTFTPGGWTGLNGYRIYDIARFTGKTARSTASIAIEMLLGQVAFGAVVIAGSIFGVPYIGWMGVLIVDASFLLLILSAIALISRPHLFRWLGDRFPPGARGRVQTLIDAVCAYQGRSGLVTAAAILGMGTHACHSLIYVATAHALGAELGVGDVFFVSAMQIFATLVPASLNGIGLREAAAVALYTRVGVPSAIALLIPMVGFAVEMLVSSFGGFVFLARKHNYAPTIRVDDPDREAAAVQSVLESVPSEQWPRVARGIAVGFAAGTFAGICIGWIEASVVLVSATYGGAASDYGVLFYGASAYAALCAISGALAVGGLAWSGRLLRRHAVSESSAFARSAAAMFACALFGLGAFRVQRDVFLENLKWKSAQGAMVLAGFFVAAVALYALLSWVLARWTSCRGGAWLLRPPAPFAMLGSFLAVTIVLGYAQSRGLKTEVAYGSSRQAKAVAEGSPVLFIVVDTLRADHLPGYGYVAGKTPNLDLFARDAMRFDQAFANASWTRPSFASIFTGRFPSSHNVMAKSDALPDDLPTIAEGFSEGGYKTAGFVTNYNVAPFFNFQQGFGAYHYLEPDFVLGANDTAAKLLLIQFLRQKIEAFRFAFGMVSPGTAYQDASVVNKHVFSWLADAKNVSSPFFLFVAYMDPHDPYFQHPYTGHGYSRAARPKPKAEEAEELRRLYDGEISFWDEYFGKLIAELKKKNLYDSMTIVVTSDHGEEFMEHGGYWHGTTLYDEQVRVPLYLKLPYGTHGGSSVKHWVQLIDLMPTVLRLQGISVPEGVQGGDLFQGTRGVYAEENHEGNDLRAFRTRRGNSELKVITANAGNPRGLPEAELFRMDQDPAEKVNLVDELRSEFAIAKEGLDTFTERAGQDAVARRPIDVSSDPDGAARLRALGYTGSGK